jgi:hypothetical protein
MAGKNVALQQARKPLNVREPGNSNGLSPERDHSGSNSNSKENKIDPNQIPDIKNSI